MDKELIKGLITLFKRFVFGTPEESVNINNYKYEYYRNGYFRELRKRKLLELKSKV